MFVQDLASKFDKYY